MPRYRETPEFGQMVRRMIRAYGRRVAGGAGQAGDIAELAALAALRADTDAAITDAVRALQAAGHSWADIGAALGITRQSAHQRYAGNPPAAGPGLVTRPDLPRFVDGRVQAHADQF